MQVQPNPLGGERRLSETHCDQCGEPRPLEDEILRGVSAGARRFRPIVEAEQNRLRDREEGA